jgi:hypothetical protein
MKKTLLTISMLFASVAMAQEVEAVKQETPAMEVPANVQQPETAPVTIEEETEVKEEQVQPEATEEETEETELDTESDVKE